MKSVTESIYGAALVVGGGLLIITGLSDAQHSNLAVAGAIFLAAVYLGGSGSALRRPADTSREN
jgi:hypothetical protein